MLQKPTRPVSNSTSTPTISDVDALVDRVRAHPNVQDKLDINRAYEEPVGRTVPFDHPLVPDVNEDVRIGDDCAALPTGEDYLLFAAEGILPAFVQEYPWFAGYSAVMVNLSDICAMGGRPLALTDMLWIDDQADGDEVWAGMQAAAEDYGVPVVGGHTSYRCAPKHLGVAVLGQARQLLTSYDAAPGETLVMAVDLDGEYFEDYPFWNASVDDAPERLQRLLPLMQGVAEEGWSQAAKDISMGGIAGTLAMLLHTSGVGAELRLDDVPKPPAAEWEKWLVSFPSFGYLMTTTDDQVDLIKQHFRAHDVACAAVGEIQADEGLRITHDGATAALF
jgi:AIR synthase-related protein